MNKVIEDLRGVLKMGKDKETPQMRREKMRQEELKNPASSIHGNNLADLVGGLSWKAFGLLILVIIIGGTYFLLKFNPPLEFGAEYTIEDKKSVVVSVGNNGFRDVEILNVSVNNNETPLETKLQVSNPLKGFIIKDNYNSEEVKEYGFTNINEVAIKSGTSPSITYENQDEGFALKDDEIYGISVIHNEVIYNIHLEYRHFGMTYNDTIYLNGH